MSTFDDGENEEESIDDYLNGRHATIFLIDGSNSMFENNGCEDETDSPFLLALRCVHHFLCNKILTADQDTVAVVLFGTNFKIDNDKYGVYSNTCIMRDLLPPEAEIILEIENFMMKKEHLDTYAKAATNPPTPSLADALWLCSSIFSKQKHKQDNRFIYLVTNNDEPYQNFSDHQKQTNRRVSDFEDASVILTLFPIGTNFDSGKIYKDLLCTSDSNSIFTLSNSLEELFTKIYRKSYKKRCTARIAFRIHDIKIGVGLYNLIRDAPMPKRILLDRRTNEPVNTITTKSIAETAETLLPSELTKFTTVGNVDLQLTTKELKTIKDSFFTGLTLLGFKTIKSLKLHLYLSPSSFIYPEEDLIKVIRTRPIFFEFDSTLLKEFLVLGSKTFMGALLNRCHTRGVAAICSLKSTTARKPRMVALLPQLLQQDMFGECLPEGFHVVFLPYSRDIRELNFEELVSGTTIPTPNRTVREIWRADESQVAVAKNIVKKLTMKNGFSPDLFENPVLHTLWKAMEGLALNRDETEPVLDRTLPDNDRIDRKVGELSDKFNEMIYPFGYDSASTAGPNSTKTRSNNDVDVENAARNGSLEKVTVPVLKNYLASQGIGSLVGKKKAQLIELVKNHLDLN